MTLYMTIEPIHLLREVIQWGNSYKYLKVITGNYSITRKTRLLRPDEQNSGRGNSSSLSVHNLFIRLLTMFNIIIIIIIILIILIRQFISCRNMNMFILVAKSTKHFRSHVFTSVKIKRLHGIILTSFLFNIYKHIFFYFFVTF